MRNFFTIIAIILLLSGQSFAENIAKVVVPVDSDVETAVGIILNGATTRQVKVTTPTLRDSHSVVVEIPYTDAERAAGAMASALVSLKNGAIALADVVSLEGDFPDNSFADLPLCNSQLKLPPLSESQLGNLKRLVEIRSQRRAVLQTKIARLLQGPALEKLRKLERGFGTGSGAPLNPGLMPYELIDRLSRLKQAISTYESNRSR
jgi:hypothetical protein